MSRSEKSVKNLVITLFCQMIGILISFFARYVFIIFLGQEYLGLNGLFTNILSVLSLTELGVGEAIVFSLYKPLAVKDIEKCKMLMKLYKNIYIFIGFTILILGLFITPFLSFFIKDIPDIKDISLIYILFVINSSISYFYSYKKNLIIADQKKYVTTLFRYGFYFLTNIIQIIFLIINKNYILFLIIQIIFTFLENYFISKKANKMYPFLNAINETKMDNDIKSEIKKNTKAMMMHKFGGVVVNSTDNILLSSFVSLSAVGIYSNYYLIINSVHNVFSQFFGAITASVGNLCATEDSKKQYKIFENIFFINFLIYSFTSIGLFCLINPFIKLWIGEKYMFSFGIVLVLIMNFYFTGLRKTSLVFREATGLFYIDRWKAVIEAIINLISSIVLVLNFGIVGVFVGTIISNILVNLWIEPYVLYKYAFKKNIILYFKKFFYYLLITIFLTFISYYITSFVFTDNLISFILSGFLISVLFLIVIIILFKNSNEYIYLKVLFKKYISRFLRKKKNTM